jgi:colanic acid/amylovoran biosynthesis glycosyltransferase
MTAKPTVIVYRHDLLPSSETFIRTQAEHLTRFTPLYVGLRRVAGLTLPDERVLALDNGGTVGRLAALRFQALGPNRRLRSALLRDHPVLVHAHFEGGGIVALPLARALAVPLVVTCHGFDVTMRDKTRWPNPVLRALYRRKRRDLQRSGNRFLAVSQYIRTQMLERGYLDASIRVHYVGVEVPDTPPPPVTSREPVILFVGRLVEKKGLEYLIRAMQRVQPAVPAARVVVIGDGPLRAPLDALSRTMRANVELLGTRAHTEVLAWMGRARILCVPMRRAANGDSDGCATTLTEAAAAGLPVVSFDAGGTPEAVVDGATGWLARECDVEGLAERIIDLLRDDTRWSAFSEAGRLRMRQCFDIRQQTALLEAIYDDVIEGRPASAGR